MNARPWAAAALLAATFGSTPALAAPLITGDAFEASLTVDGVVAGPYPGTAGAAADDLRKFHGFGSDGFFRVEWVDEDSVDIEFFIGSLGGPLTDGSFTISGLDFTDGGAPRAIVGVSFNRGASNVDSFVDGGSLGGPALSFTATSISGVLSMSEGLVADGPRLRYDLAIAAVPEPASVAMMLLGLGLCGLGMRRARR